MGVTAGQFRDGMIVGFHCLGTDVQPSHLYLKGSQNGVRLSDNLTDAGAQWTVRETLAPGVFAFQCGDGGGFLDGRTLDSSVGLAPNFAPPFIGTAWKVVDFQNPDLGGFDHVALQCQGNLGNWAFGFLDGRTGITDGSVGLAMMTSAPFTGTHWEIVFPGEIGGGSNPTDVPHPNV